MRIGVPKESLSTETRVALTPETISKLVSSGHTVTVQKSAGNGSGFSDSDYQNAGSELDNSVESIAKSSDLLIHVGIPDPSELEYLKPGSVLISILGARTELKLLELLTKSKITAFSMELVPRIARAQRMDVLSSQASIAGYKGALLAAMHYGKYFPMMMTAAGTIPPAKVLVIGAGVAGLQAIATANRLGAVVYAYDVRPTVKEQVESLGATFIELPETHLSETDDGYAKEQDENDQSKQRELLKNQISDSDIIITTAAVPGRPAPKLIDKQMLSIMKSGSVILDLASDTGGNCDVTQPGKIITTENGVIVDGPTNLASTVPTDASTLYSRNIMALLEILIDKNGELHLDFEDDIIDAMCITHDGKLRLTL